MAASRSNPAAERCSVAAVTTTDGLVDAAHAVDGDLLDELLLLDDLGGSGDGGGLGLGWFDAISSACGMSEAEEWFRLMVC